MSGFINRYLIMGFLTIGYYQNTQAQSTVGVNLLGGYLISHHPQLQNMEAHIGGFEVCKQWWLDSSSAGFKGANIGVSAFYMWLGKPNINGSVIAAIPHIEANLYKRNRHQWRLRVGVGVGYITKPFSYPNNVQNKAIGSHLNGSMQLMLGYNYKISRQFSIYSGLGMTHFSNANFKKPNLGINLPHLAFGIHYTPKVYSGKYLKLLFDVSYSYRLMASVAVATKQIDIDDPKRVGIYTISLDFVKAQKAGHFLRFGTDFFIDRSYPYQKFQPVKYDTIALAQVLEHGFRGGYEWRAGKVGAITDIGFYTYRPQNTKRRYYFMVGVMYYPTKKINLYVKLKTHLAVADYFSWGLGYQIYAK